MGHKTGFRVTGRVYRHAVDMDRTELAKQMSMPRTTIIVEVGFEDDAN